MSNIDLEIKSFLNLGTQAEYNALFHGLDKVSQDKVSAILSVLEIGDPISVTNAKLILHACEDIIERCTPVSIGKTGS